MSDDPRNTTQVRRGSRKSTSSRKSSSSRKSRTGRKSTSSRKSRTGRKSMSGRKSIKSNFSKKTSSGGKKRSSVDVAYNPVTLNVSNIRPFFLLLNSQERSLVLKALNYIYKHIKFNWEDVKLMYDGTCMDDVKDLAQVQEKFIPESALRLLALVTKDPYSHKWFTEDDKYMRFVYEQLKSKTDPVLQYAAEILANLSQDISIVRAMCANNSGLELKTLIDNLSHLSPDVCHNTMKIIGNLFHDLECGEKYVNLKEWSFVPLFNLLEKPYIEVQNKALTLIEWLGCQKNPKNELKDRFLEQRGVDRMFGVLMNFQWRDIHGKALEILRVFLETNEDRIRTLELEGVGKFVDYIDFIEDDVLIAKVLGNILDIATTVFGKLELVELGFHTKVTGMLSDGTAQMKESACYIINEMLKNIETVRLFTELAPIAELVEIVVDEDHNWDLVGGALGVLHNLCKFSGDMAYLMGKEPQRRKFKEWGITHLLTMPVKCKNVMYDLLCVVCQHPMVRPYLLEFGFVWAFLQGLRSRGQSYTHVQAVSAEALFHIIPVEPYARQFILLADGMAHLCRVLFTAKDPQLISMICNTIRVAAESDENMLVALLQEGTLEWLVKKIKMWTEIESMEWAANALQNRFLPAKFEYRGRLSFNDTTKNGFYIRKEYDKPAHLPIPPSKVDHTGGHETVFMANFFLDSERDSADRAKVMYREKLKRDSMLDQKCVSSYGMEYDDAGSEELAGYDLAEDPLYIDKCKQNEIVPQNDPRLMGMYEDLKKKLVEADDRYGPRDYSMPFDHSWVLSRVEAIVDVVKKAMDGNEFTEPCSNHTMKLYLQEMKIQGKTGVIPLGKLQKGGSLERAMLFKVLADKVGLPCSFWRGTHGNGWNEIALLNLGTEFPSRNKEETKVKTEDKPDMPTRLMYPTHVVDLMEKPGRLIEVGTPEAHEYTGRPVTSVLHKVPESEPPPINTCLKHVPANEY